jgi:hypothetical protein
MEQRTTRVARGDAEGPRERDDEQREDGQLGDPPDDRVVVERAADAVEGRLDQWHAADPWSAKAPPLAGRKRQS